MDLIQSLMWGVGKQNKKRREEEERKRLEQERAIKMMLQLLPPGVSGADLSALIEPIVGGEYAGQAGGYRDESNRQMQAQADAERMSEEERQKNALINTIMDNMNASKDPTNVGMLSQYPPEIQAMLGSAAQTRDTNLTTQQDRATTRFNERNLTTPREPRRPTEGDMAREKAAGLFDIVKGTGKYRRIAEARLDDFGNDEAALINLMAGEVSREEITYEEFVEILKEYRALLSQRGPIDSMMEQITPFR